MRSIFEIRKHLTDGAYDALLSRLYCRPPERLGPYRDRVDRVAEGYLRVFGKAPTAEASVFSAPGRTEIGGNHTDHQRGKVLAGAVDLDALGCAAPNGGGSVRIYSEGYGLTEIDCGSLAPVRAEKNTTKAIVRGMLARLAALGYRAEGFDAYILSDVPVGSGLSSSACFEVLLGTIFNNLFCGGALSAIELARAGQYAENVYFGKPSGLLDQIGCAMGGIISVDFQNEAVPECRAVDFDFSSAGYALCVIDTGSDHSDLTRDYAAIPAEMRSVAAALGGEVLREADEARFYAAVPVLRETLGDRAVLRAMHYFAECRRVEEQAAALEQNDFSRFLRLVDASGRSSWTYLQNVDAHRDPARQPVAMALAMTGHCLNGRGACRVHGGGFAGAIQAYVPLEMLTGFRREMDTLFGQGACRNIYIRPVGGCVVAD